jgi:ankyrin repeat protein
MSGAVNADIVRLLTDAGADIDYVDGEGYTLLRRAAESGPVALVKALLEMKASPAATRTGPRAFHDWM